MGRHRPHLLLTVPEGVDRIPIDDETRHHLVRVLRYKPGSPLTYTDGSGLFGEGVFEPEAVVRGEERWLGRSGQLTVAVAPPSSKDRSRFLVEKLSELGVNRLVWLKTRHGEGHPPNADKAAAWAKAALEQSRGAWLMELDGEVPVSDVAGLGTPVFADREGCLVTELSDVADPVLCVGPEGGFAPGEVPEDALRLSLGSTVLRVETAAIAGAVLLENRF